MTAIDTREALRVTGHWPQQRAVRIMQHPATRSAIITGLTRDCVRLTDAELLALASAVRELVSQPEPEKP